jgi:DHA2 family methylenomycin A resistance protein-like MFS transporter
VPAATVAPPAEPATAVEARPGWALGAALLGMFVITFDAVVVNVALPSIRDDFGGGISGLQWVVDGYTLMFAGLLLTCGALSDRVGARRALRWGMVLFVVASVACGLAPSMPLLVAARFLQGSAAAVIMPSSMALISQAYPNPARRAWAVGMWALGGGLASSSAPVLGGLLSLVSWRLIFFINVPVGALALVLLTRVAVSPRRWRPFDWTGQVTAVVAMGGLTFGAIEAGSLGITAPRVIVAFVVAVVALVAFINAEGRVAHPMMPLELFRSRNVVVSMAVGFAFVVGYYGLPFVMSLYLQQLRGLSSFGAGLVFVPMMVSGAVLTPFAAAIASRVGTRTLITVGLVLMSVGLVVLAFMPADAAIVGVALLMLPVGVAGPLIMPPTMALLLNSVPDAQVGTTSGVFNTSRQVGGALSVAVFGALLAGDDFMTGLRLSLLLAAGAALSAAAAALSLRRAGHLHLTDLALMEGVA